MRLMRPRNNNTYARKAVSLKTDDMMAELLPVSTLMSHPGSSPAERGMMGRSIALQYCMFEIQCTCVIVPALRLKCVRQIVQNFIDL